jgi:hypothetical protein
MFVRAAGRAGLWPLSSAAALPLEPITTLGVAESHLHCCVFGVVSSCVPDVNERSMCSSGRHMWSRFVFVVGGYKEMPEEAHVPS